MGSISSDKRLCSGKKVSWQEVKESLFTKDHDHGSFCQGGRCGFYRHGLSQKRSF